MLTIMPALTGILLAASFPRADQGYLAWVAFIPLTSFVLRSRSIKAAFAGGLIAGCIEIFVLLIWMPAVLTRYGGLSLSLAWLAYSLLVLVLACYPAAACALSKYLILRMGDGCILIFPVVWIVFEYAQSFSPFGGLPWLLAGYSQSRFLTIIQIADITGVYGISFLLLWTAASVVWLIRRKGHGFGAYAPAVLSVLLLVSCVVYGKVSLGSWGEIHPHFRAAMLQGNISFDEPEPVLVEKYQNGYVRMADRVKASDLLILPESPTPLFFETNPQYRAVMEKLAGRFPLGLVFNNIRNTENGGYLNSAYFLDRNGVPKGIYDKIHLVPFGEYIPLKGLFSFIETVTKDVSAFDPGGDYRVIAIGNHPSNAIICFEAVFPRLVSRFVQQGSQLIINLTNDGWYGDSAAPYQHLAIARFRAVENRRFLLRATNSGISAFIEPTGRIRASTAILQKAICEGGFEFIAATTVYTRYGDVLVLLCAIISCGSVIFAVLHSTGIHSRVEKKRA